MNGFARAVLMAIRYRLTFLGAVGSALLVALLWGGNIGTLYPIVQVVMDNDSLQGWVQREIEQTQAESQALGQKIADLENEGAAPSVIKRRQDRLEALHYKLWIRQTLKPWIDRFLPSDPFQTVALVIAALVAGTAVKGVFLVLGSVFVDRLSQKTILELRNEYYQKTLRLDMANFSEQGCSELMSRFTYDMDSLASGLQTLFGKATREPLKLVVCLIGAAMVCWRLLLLSLVLAPLAAYLISRLSGSLKRANRRAMEDVANIYGTLQETLGGIKLVKTFTAEGKEATRFRGQTERFFQKSMRIAWYNALVHPVTEMMGIFIIAMAVIGGAYLILNQETHLFGLRMSDRPLSIPELLLFFGLLAGVSDPARKLSEVLASIQRGSAAADRIFQSLDRRPTIVDPVNPAPFQTHTKSLEFKDIQFRYQEGPEVLRGISINLPFGQTLAIVGANGCGKSTLTNLVPRLFDPTSGAVLIDGVDIRSWKLSDLRSQIGMVSQEALLFDDTVFNNIAYGRVSATREEVIEAAKRAHADRFIVNKLDAGYETVVGPGGNRLSGGQRQRIALARAILRDPRILILDEATSQIDLESEQLIHRALEEFVRNRTTLIITHRLETLALADSVLVLEHGKILDHGTHEQLMNRCPFYRNLHQLDFRQSA